MGKTKSTVAKPVEVRRIDDPIEAMFVTDESAADVAEWINYTLFRTGDKITRRAKVSKSAGGTTGVEFVADNDFRFAFKKWVVCEGGKFFIYDRRDFDNRYSTVGTETTETPETAKLTLTVDNIARALYGINPDPQPWDGDGFGFDEAGRRGLERYKLAMKQAQTVAALADIAADATVAVPTARPTAEEIAATWFGQIDHKLVSQDSINRGKRILTLFAPVARPTVEEIANTGLAASDEEITDSKFQKERWLRIATAIAERLPGRPESVVVNEAVTEIAAIIRRDHEVANFPHEGWEGDGWIEGMSIPDWMDARVKKGTER